jgi:hypothetical protein
LAGQITCQDDHYDIDASSASQHGATSHILLLAAAPTIARPPRG